MLSRLPAVVTRKQHHQHYKKFTATYYHYSSSSYCAAGRTNTYFSQSNPNHLNVRLNPNRGNNWLSCLLLLHNNNIQSKHNYGRAAIIFSQVSSSRAISRFYSSTSRVCLSSSQQQHQQPKRNQQQHNHEQKKKEKKRLDVAIVGLPNAGKSQLLNVLTQSKVAGVSRKRHTTREGIMGVRTLLEHNTQLVFVDTPGYLRFKQARRENMLRDLITSATTSMEYVDYTLLVIDAAKAITDSDKNDYHNVRETIVALMLHALSSRGRVESETTTFLEEHDHDHDDDIDIDDGKSIRMNIQPRVMTNQEEENNVGIPNKPKFAIVLNKVDLIKPKTKLIDIAMEYGEISDNAIKFHYYGHTVKLPEPEPSPSAIGNKKKKQQQQQPKLKHAFDPIIFDQLKDIELNENILPPIFYISALQNDGIDDIIHHLTQMATPCLSLGDVDSNNDIDDEFFDDAWVVPPNEVTTLDIKERIEEIIREKIYRCTHREVPHNIQQKNMYLHIDGDDDDNSNENNNNNNDHDDTNVKKKKMKFVTIHQTLIVKTKSHQRLLIGTGQRTIERIRVSAQRDLCDLFGGINNAYVDLRLIVQFKKKKSKN